MKIHLNDELQALLLLSSLLDNWETLVVSYGNFSPNGVITLQIIKGNMHNEDTEHKDMGIDTLQALVTKNRGKSKSRFLRGRLNLGVGHS